MDEQALLHQISVETDANIELLKELICDQKLLAQIRGGKLIDATLNLRASRPLVSLGLAKMIVEAFSKAIKDNQL